MSGSAPRIVMKFGGTSVGDLDRIRAVAERVKKQKDAGCDVLVVVSAMAGETNRLVGFCQSLSPLHDPKEYDSIVATGEQVTSGLLAIALQKLGVPSRSFAGWQVPILTDSAYGKASLDTIDGTKLLGCMAEGMVPVVAGFQGVAPDGRISTLGRGGSDTSAVALAAAIKRIGAIFIRTWTGFTQPTPVLCPKRASLIKLPMRKCWNWRQSVPRCCKPAV